MIKSLLVSAILSLVSVSAFASQFTIQDFRTAYDAFGLNTTAHRGEYDSSGTEGEDMDGNICKMGWYENGYTASFTATRLTDGQTDSYMSVIYDNQDYEILGIEVTGSAKSGGTFKAKVRERSYAHKTDFGWKVGTYYVDSEIELVFAANKLVKWSLSMNRPGLSKVVLDPDFRGAHSIKNCHAK